MLQEQGKKEISQKNAFLTVGILLMVLLLGMILFKLDLHVLLIVDIVILCLISARLGYSFDELMSFIQDSIATCVPVMFIFLLIGGITAAWIMSGTVPGIIYYGLKFISPKVFLPLGLVLCTLTSLAIGTAWGTVSTVGIALLGMGYSLGIPGPITAGMVISGSFFGDKMSPISDTAALASQSSGSTIYKHIASMFLTSGPAFFVTLIIFWCIGLRYAGGGLDTKLIDEILFTIESNYRLHPLILILPMVALFSLNIKQVPAVPAMLVGISVGVIVAVVYQGEQIVPAISALNYGYFNESGMEFVDNLLNRGGMQEMMWTFSLAFIALSFGGILDRVGFLRTLIVHRIDKIHNVGILSVVVIVTTFITTVAVGEVYLSLVLCGNMFRETFEKKGLAPHLLSRFIEEGGTLMQVFIPWSTSGSFVSGTLGISTLVYTPFVFMNYLNPLISILFSFFGIATHKKWKAKAEQQIQA